MFHYALLILSYCVFLQCLCVLTSALPSGVGGGVASEVDVVQVVAGDTGGAGCGGAGLTIVNKDGGIIAICSIEAKSCGMLISNIEC